MHHSKADTAKEVSRKLVLIGNPNVGKSVIFGALTGRYATVSNYPGTTVEVSRGTASIGGEKTAVIDSPGVNSLVPMSEDEKVTRDILLNEEISTVVQVLDAKNIRRGLFITLQLIEMGLPVTLALNMYDEAGERGLKIDIEKLSEAIGLNVLPMIATQRWNLEKINEVFALHRLIETKIDYTVPIEEGVREITALLPEGRLSDRSIALSLLSNDVTIHDWLVSKAGPETLEKVEEIRGRIQACYSDPLGYIINRIRLKAADAIVSKTVSREDLTKGRLLSILGTLSMHPLWGMPILLFVLFLMYEFVGVLGAGISVDFFESIIFGEYLNPWVTRVVEYVLPSGLIHDLIVGEYGIVTMAVTYAIAIVLPIVGFFFIFFSILEDSGYLPRLAIMVDKVFRLMGLNGKAVLPMVLGLGCDTMATMTTRILETRKERVVVTLLLALGVPCSAQLGVILGMLGAISFSATVTWAAVVIAVMLFIGYLTSKILPGESSDFILEIPPLRVPQLSNIVLKTLVRVEWYLKEALPLFVLGTLVLFVLDKTNALVVLERLAAPLIVKFMGLPIESTQAFIVGFLRRDYGAAGLLALQRDGMLDPVQAVVSLVTITLFVPCIANLFMIIKERGAATALWMTLFIFPFAIFVGGILNLVFRTLGVSF